MRAAVLSYRFPWPGYTGDRLRAAIWIEALAAVAEVSLIAPAGRVPAGSGASHIVVPARAGSAAAAVSRAAITSLPWHTVVAGRYDWKETLSRAGHFDLAVVILSRLHPWVSESLRATLRVLDAIDSSSRGMAERARAGGLMTRRFWSSEAEKALRLERDLHAWYDRLVVVSELESSIFGAETAVVSSGAIVDVEYSGQRDFDFGFWGRLAYFANSKAVKMLLDEVWPAIRSARPAARLLIAGADAPRAILRRDGRNGITVVSPMNGQSLVRRVRVALFPVRFGTGQANKVLEAAASGCAIIASPEMLRAVPAMQSVAWSAASSPEMAAKAVALIDDPETAREMAVRLREIVRVHYSREQTLDQLRALAGFETVRR
ncbi:MAG TPA: glycosyltransferase [Thermoanaerobaculia bacterium]|nr:glycosyltransferase [Thermoanaerobaculia bacterium]